MPVAVLIATDLLFTEHTTAARAEEHPILPLMDGQAGELNPPAILPHATVNFRFVSENLHKKKYLHVTSWRIQVS